MAIQFPCPSCRQPIEVDDEWASSHVGCPYCHKTVLAPAVSEPVGGVSIPRGRPAGGYPSAPAYDAQPVDPRRGKTVGIVALVLSIVTLIGFNVGDKMLTGRFLPDDIQGVEEYNQAIKEWQQDWTQQFEQGQVPEGFGLLALFVGFMFLFWLSGVICGVVAVRRPGGRRLGVIALVVSALLPLMIILSAVQLG